MKKTFAIIIACVLLVGCGSSEGENAEVSSGDPAALISETYHGVGDSDTMASEAVSEGSVDSSPESTGSIDSDSQNTMPGSTTYGDIANEFENAIERTRREAIFASDYTEFGAYIYEIYGIFTEMLNYEESLADFEASKEYVVEERFGSKVSIDVVSVFTDGATGYRVFGFGADAFPPNLLRIQIFDKDTVESQHLYYYWSGEGGAEGGIVYCGFLRDSDRLFLIIIHKEKRVDGIDSYSLVNYEIEGRMIRNHNALKEEVLEDKWQVTSEVSLDDQTVLRIAYGGVSYFEGYDFDNDSRICFEDNKLTIALCNEDKDEISLLFSGGFWEVLEI